MAALLQFPKERAKGRIRKRDSRESMGCWALDKFDGDKPTNVVRLARVRAESAPGQDHGTLALALSGFIFNVLTPDQAGRVRDVLEYYENCRHDPMATTLLDMIDKGRA